MTPKPFASSIAPLPRSPLVRMVTAVTAAVVLAALCLLTPTILYSQSSPSSAAYWQYAASGRLSQVLSADIDGNGVDEFVVVDETGRVELLASDGTRIWTFTAPGPVSALTTIRTGDSAQLSIVLGLRNELLLLAPNGALAWRAALQPFSTAPTLLTAGGQELETSRLEEYHFDPLQIVASDFGTSGQEQILVLLNTGELLRYTPDGEVAWRHARYSGSSNAAPQMIVADLDADGRDEVVLALFEPRRFSELVYLDDGTEVWEQPLSGRVTALEVVQYEPDARPAIAVGTSLGHVYLYDSNRNRFWFRTLNVPVSSMAAFALPDGPALAVGTAAGTVTAFDAEGRRFWNSYVDDSASQVVTSLSAPPGPPRSQQPVLAAVLANELQAGATADLYLLGQNGQIFSKTPTVDQQGLTRFVDSNHDGNNELLVVRFATLDLTGIGVGNRENVVKWDYALNAAPLAWTTADLDDDGSEEVIIGTEDGRIHALSADQSLRWLHDTGGAIAHLLALPPDEGGGLLVARAGGDTDPQVTAVVERREPSGKVLWDSMFNTPVTALLRAPGDGIGGAAFIAGTQDGHVVGLSSNGARLWDIPVDGLDNGVRHMLTRPATSSHPADLIVSGDMRVFSVNPAAPEETAVTARLVTYSQPITGLHHIEQPGSDENRVSMLILTSDGNVHGLNWRGLEKLRWNWPQQVDGIPTASMPDLEEDGLSFPQNLSSLLIATNRGELTRLDVEDNRPVIAWQVAGLGDLTRIHWRDTDGDDRPDLVLAGDRSGEVRLFAQAQARAPEQTYAPLQLDSSVFALTTLGRDASQSPDLLAITDNGMVQLFREQENRPPLLTNPAAAVSGDGFDVSVGVNDVEGDAVQVQLQLFDPAVAQWVERDTQTARNGAGVLTWRVNDPPQTDTGLQYRFAFDDGFHTGELAVPPGPVARVQSPFAGILPAVALIGGGALLLAGIISLQQSRTPEARARRFFERLKQQPSGMLELLEKQYAVTRGAPDFLLNLASQARQNNDRMIANLADGLFLLADRPQAGLSIMARTLGDMQRLEPPLSGTQRWYMTCKTGLSMLEAPSATELSLLLPQLVQLLNLRAREQAWSPELDALRPILTSIRDSERIDQLDDRLVYLNEASLRLRQLEEQLSTFPFSIERNMVQAIRRRWTGLVSAEIEELRGRAVLSVTLKTKRVVPNRHTAVAVEIRNDGRSAAENIVATLDDDPAYAVFSPPQAIPFLPPGHSRRIEFVIEPQVSTRLRLGLTLTYDDRNQAGKQFAFGDMISLLPPVRDFRPLENPYMPGTPLRPQSGLFYGREDLYTFIAENMTHTAKRNVLILVGQRRTGKTSAILRLGEHMPEALLPVYIDCQSLGVMPGIPPLLQELAWYIADALALIDIDVEVPEITYWQEDPIHRFQRQFLPQVKAQLPENVRILLVFDEFETFEDMVNDSILPPTFFPYLRHLMQHEDRLGFIFVGTRRLEEMTSDYWSVLFNIALYRKIGYLTPEATRRLITEPVAPNLIYDDLALDKIWRVTAGHPYFLQLVCYTLVKQANENRTGYVTISDVNAALNEMLSLGEVHFAYLWQRSTFTEKALLTAVAHLMDRNVPFSPEELIAYLDPYDVHLEPVEVTAALNRLVERDIMGEVHVAARTLYELRLGLVGLWVAQNKSLSKLYASQTAKADRVDTAADVSVSTNGKRARKRTPTAGA